MLLNSAGPDPANASVIIDLTEGTDYRDQISQVRTRSAPVSLQAGTHYYFEIRHASDGVDGHMNVGV
jgi:hypothetical protein